MKKILQISLSAALLFFARQGVLAADFFPQLEQLQIEGAIPQELLLQAEKVENENPDTTYLRFESAEFSYPHYVEIDNATQEIVYIELKIPETHLESYQNYRASLGKPEVVSKQTPSLALVGFPSQGVGFIVSERNQNFLLITKYPIKETEELLTEEGENFAPVSHVDSIEPGILKPEPPSLLERIGSFFADQQPLFWILVIVFIVSLGGLSVFGYRLWKEQRQSKTPS